MIRLLLIFGLLFLIVRGLISYWRYRLRHWLNPLQQKEQAKGLSQKLVKCDTCGTFILASQAYQTKERYYCSQEHAK